jgi:phage-related protein
MKKLTSDFVKKEIETRGGVVSETWKYKNAKTPIDIICNKNHPCKMTWDNIKHNHWCPHCAKNIIDESYIKDFIIKKGGILPDNWKYKNSRTHIQIICKKCNSKFNITWNNIQRGCWCRKCATEKNKAKQRKSKNEIQLFIEKNGGVLPVKWNYENARAPLHVICKKCNYIRITSWNSIRNGYGCPTCSAHKTENSVRKKLETILKIKLPKSKPTWLRYTEVTNNMELDGYNEKYKIAFEYQGRQHYDKTHYFNSFSENQFTYQLNRDKKKRELCEKMGVKLIIINEGDPVDYKYLKGLVYDKCS